MPRINVSVTADFDAMLTKYKNWRGLKSKSAALVELAALGAKRMTMIVPPIKASWGGDRTSDDWEEIIETIEDFEIQIRGFPPEG